MTPSPRPLPYHRAIVEHLQSSEPGLVYVFPSTISYGIQRTSTTVVDSVVLQSDFGEEFAVERIVPSPGDEIRVEAQAIHGTKVEYRISQLIGKTGNHVSKLVFHVKLKSTGKHYDVPLTIQSRG
jgi:hypothetical protein